MVRRAMQPAIATVLAMLLVACSSGNSGGSEGTGGATGSGGSSSLGGTSETGGMVGTGGAVTGTGGSTQPPTGGGSGSPGCGSSNTTSPCSKSGTTCSLDVGGTPRTYYVQLPASYSSSKPYPVVFQFHPMGGTAEMAMTMYRLNSGLPDVIYVSPQGLSASGGSTGWPNTNGQDIAFTKAMLADVQAKYCVDSTRIFSTGFSYGGMMSFTIGCEMSDVFRAIAPMAGAMMGGCRGGSGHAIAMWGAHGLSDTTVSTDSGRSARDRILQQNHCGTETTPTEPSPCVAYGGCDSGYPVTWCEFEGGHQIPSFASNAIAAFFKQF